MDSKAKRREKEDQKAWTAALARASERSILEISGADGLTCINGVFDLQACADKAAAPPLFQKRGDPDTWLYYAADRHWWISNTESKERRETSGFASSKVAHPGTLPDEAEGWWVCTADGQWHLQTVKVVAHEAAEFERARAATWREARRRAAARPLLDVAGAEGQHAAAVNGTYELELGGDSSSHSNDENVIFRHENGKSWLYVAQDCCWWVSMAANKNARATKGWAHSEMVQPGMLPTAATCWRIASGSEGFQVQALEFTADLPLMATADGEAEASAPPPAAPADPEAAAAPGLALVVSGAAGDAAHAVNGTYLAVTGSETSPTVLRKREDATKWFYLADDGAWWIGGTASKDALQAEGWAHSRPAPEPAGGLVGLAAVPGRWEVRRGSRWQPQTLHLVARPLEEVEAAEERAWTQAFEQAAAQGVLELELGEAAEEEEEEAAAAYGPVVTGNYVLSTERPPGQPPSFFKQADPEIWLYLAHNRAWWVGGAEAKEARAARGWAHSLPVEAGTLPTAAGGWRLLPAGGGHGGLPLRASVQAGTANTPWVFWELCCTTARRHTHGSLWEAQVLSWKRQEKQPLGTAERSFAEAEPSGERIALQGGGR